MYAAVLEEGGFLFEFFLANGAPHVQGHSGRPAVLYHVWKTAFARLTLLEVVQSAEIRSGTEHGMVHSFCVFEVCGILQVTR